MVANRPVEIYGDGETFRDFCYVENVLQANLLASTVQDTAALNRVYNVALGDRTTLNELFEMIRVSLAERFAHLESFKPQYRAFREGDVRFSQADIGKARSLLGYAPTHRVADGMRATVEWHVARAGAGTAP
jgi:UDP-N-acetylglucosamine 4-epimerase